MTGLFRKWSEAGARSLLSRRPGWGWLVPFTMFGQYGRVPGEFSCYWYWAQLAHAMLLIGLPARLVALGTIVASLNLLPDALSPVHGLAALWFHSGLSCEARTGEPAGT